jgi:hypothetical protein
MAIWCRAPLRGQKVVRSVSPIIPVAIAMALTPLMVSSQSIWIDEAQTWTYASMESLNEVIDYLGTDRKSEAQMPLGMVSAWAWAKVLGTSEWALRAPNILYAWGAILAFFLVGKRLSQPWLPFLLAIQPFFWLYVNEARPYALQFFGGSLLILAVVEVLLGRTKSWVWIMSWAAGSFITSGAIMLGGIPVAIATSLIVIYVFRGRIYLSKTQLVSAMSVTVGLGILALYYVTTLLRGSGGAKIWSLGPQNLVFSMVEFMGFSGFLPSRQILREILKSPDQVLLANNVDIVQSIFLLALLVAWGGVAFQAVRNIRNLSPVIFPVAAYFVGSIVVMVFLALLAGFPFWGRHLAPLLPAFVLMLGFVIWPEPNYSNCTTKIPAIGICVLLLTSSLFLRFSDIHAKDDYRSAAKLALEALGTGKIVWWAANDKAGKYYGISMEKPSRNQGVKPGTLVYAVNLSGPPESSCQNPDLVILSKPDIYDQNQYLRKAFSISGETVDKQLNGFYILRIPKMQPIEQ